MNEIELLIDLHKYNPRQGPGSTADTFKALQLLPEIPKENWHIADIGCGTGAQSLDLARFTGAEIIAVDLFSEFTQELETRAKAQGLAAKIKTLTADMNSLPLQTESFDLIWSEGAIYSMGFENGLSKWRPFLKEGAFIALSEITWLKSERPSELESLWKEEYPEIGTAEDKIAALTRQGFNYISHFILEPSAWINEYYQPLMASIPAFLERHGDSPSAKAVAKANREEYEQYLKYQEYYSYGFYLARKS